MHDHAEKYSAKLWMIQHVLNLHAKVCLSCGSLEKIDNFYIHMNVFMQDFPNGTKFNYCYIWVSSEITTVSLRILNLNTSAFYGRSQAQYKLARWVFDSIAIANTSPHEKKHELQALFNFFIMTCKM